MNRAKADISLPQNDLHETDARWFAVHTKYKCEKFVAELLAKRDIAVYLPLITNIKKYVSGIKKREVPLINSYVFVKICKQEYHPVLSTLYVRGFLKQRKSLVCIPNKEIDILRRVVGELEEVYSSSYDLRTGDTVEIIAGNLTGLQGTLLQAEGSNRFVIQLESIGMQLSMSVDKNKLRLKKRALNA